MNQNLHAGVVLSVAMLTVCLLVFVVARHLLQPTLDPLNRASRRLPEEMA
ncbi:MAG: hypothetical protein RBU25_01870 [Lentisphaeria bacterium]|jgi:hypothetical protein|nr:hypothetical protein [Lentisphaeria bacterium]